jgi:hypothetical protein
MEAFRGAALGHCASSHLTLRLETAMTKADHEAGWIGALEKLQRYFPSKDARND